MIHPYNGQIVVQTGLVGIALKQATENFRRFIPITFCHLKQGKIVVSVEILHVFFQGVVKMLSGFVGFAERERHEAGNNVCLRFGLF